MDLRKIKIKETIEVEKEIEIVFPYYFKQVIDSDHSTYIIYGKIDSEFEVSIRETIDFDGQKVQYELEKEKWYSSGGYFKEKYKSSKEEYEAVKQRAVKFLSEF